MSIPTKRNVSGIISVFCAVCMVYCIGRMIPYGLSGETGKVRLYFTLTVVALVVSLPSGVAYYYYRNSKVTEDEKLERMRVEVDMLSRVGRPTSRSPRLGTEDTNPRQPGSGSKS